jgi:hypothetical protein
MKKDSGDFCPEWNKTLKSFETATVFPVLAKK